MKKATAKMYAGPSIRRYGLINGNVYIGETGNLQTAFKDIPELKLLFLNIDENLMANKRKVKEKGTRENIIYNNIVKNLGGKNGV